MTQAPALLLEIGCEDLPARYVAPLAAALAKGLGDGLDRRSVAHGTAQTYATPRRIAVIIKAVAQQQPDQTIERKGPALAAAFKDGAATRAAEGFARSCAADVAALAQEDGYLVFRKAEPGKATAELLPAIFEECLKLMDALVPKRMRWGGGDETFVRPVKWLLCLHGGAVLPLSRFGLQSGRTTYGHRFHAPEPIELGTPADYVAVLEAAYVQPDLSRRIQDIRSQVEVLASAAGGHARITEDLLAEVAALVEYPVAIAGCIEDRFLRLPPEVIVSTVETNQRYFTVFSDQASVEGQMASAAGYLKPVFITVANLMSRDVDQVIAGNERVVRPRLSDAMFFWEQDRQQPLDRYAARLGSVTFQKDLGSVGDKTSRVRSLCALIATECDADVTISERAATLAKCDLVTRMVFEFPELQGLMGAYYASAGGESAAVAAAIRDQYLPAQQGTSIPATREGCVLALADRLDTLAGIFAIGQKPTASKDPYALRRAALGALRICVEGGLEVDLRGLLDQALQLQPAGQRDDQTLDALWTFVVERLRGYCTDRGATIEQFDAVRVTGASVPLDFERRLSSLRAFAGSEAAQSLAAADKRARNILRQAGHSESATIEASLFESDTEHALLAELERVEAVLVPLRAANDYPAMLNALSALRAPVDRFFDAVMVMADDEAVKRNRLALLATLDALCREVADLSLLPG